MKVIKPLEYSNIWLKPLSCDEYRALYYTFREVAYFLDWAQDIQEGGWNGSKYRRNKEPQIQFTRYFVDYRNLLRSIILGLLAWYVLLPLSIVVLQCFWWLLFG